jgi:hypothetical protein
MRVCRFRKVLASRVGLRPLGFFRVLLPRYRFSENVVGYLAARRAGTRPASRVIPRARAIPPAAKGQSIRKADD